MASPSHILDAFRRWGYLKARLDPLDRLPRQEPPELEFEGEEAEAAARVYCGTLGVEFMHIPDGERRRWVAERMEGESPGEPDRERVLDQLIRAEIFEQVLQKRYLGTKRYSLEGVTALVPFLIAALKRAHGQGAGEIVLAMSHRGRLNVMVNVVGKSTVDVMAGFEDVNPRSVLGGGDVKYHLGATHEYGPKTGRPLRMHLVSNPSHLEAVNPVAQGRVRAKQTRRGEAGGRQVLGVLLHGDAAFAGQGIAAESLNLSAVEGFEVGGMVHVVVNNLIGFTTPPKSYNSSRFSTDLARRLPVPIFHVNGEDPEAVARVARLAVDYRYAFASDVVVDLIGYRRHGHSEVDDPTITQPRLYEAIEKLPRLWRSYAADIGLAEEEAEKRAEKAREEFSRAQEEAEKIREIPRLARTPSYWDGFRGGRYDPACEVDTGVPEETLATLAERLTHLPEDFHPHPKVEKLLEQRAKMGRGEQNVDFGFAETLAIASLLTAGVPVRLSGQDSRRATFNQRHAVLIDHETEDEYLPLAHLGEDQAAFEIYDSILSEAAVLGFEYGFSRDYPEALVVWEAQFGDFANGAQVTLDQFVCAGEDKWGLYSGLTVLLPHGYEGQGPEHSSARMERFLQLAAEDNIQVLQPSTAAQYFHLLRRQVLRRWRKPAIVFTPKSMLRAAPASSPLAELARPRFRAVLPDEEIEQARRVMVCTGKIAHELRREREERGDGGTAILTLEQLYPFPEKELAAALAEHPGARQILWVQEEPANMGALFFVEPRLDRLARSRPLRTIKRSASASPATGSPKAHSLEQKTLLNLAFARHE